LLSFLSETVRCVGLQHFERGHPEAVPVVLFNKMASDFGPVFVVAIFSVLLDVCVLGAVFRTAAVKRVARFADVEVTTSHTTAQVHQVFSVAVT
jgi:hypothetical protein